MLEFVATASPRSDLLRGWWALLGLALGGVALVVLLALVTAMRRANARGGQRRRPTSDIPDAWAEAGRRAAVPDDDADEEPGDDRRRRDEP